MEEKKEVTFHKPASKSQDLSKELEKVSLFNISSKGYQKIIDAGLDINHFFIIHLCIKDQMIYNDKHQIMMLKLLRKQLITEDWKPTILGLELYNSVAQDQEVDTKKTKIESGFDKWWKTYPGTDDFEYKNIKFKGSRSLRVSKKICKTKYEAIINEGEYTDSELLQALEMEIQLKKDQSIECRSNKLGYMQGSATYLNQRSFEGFIEKIRSKGNTKPTKGTSNTMLI